jgi:aspartyl-tRNA(Asn)/glutamyl-tRNA(Gln) amidotransferase subunit C
MTFTEQELDNLSSLARIDITKDEKQKMLQDMQAILGYVSEINDIEGDGVKQEYLVHNVVREDIVTHSTGSNTEALMNEAPATKDGYVKVEQVLK